MSRIAIEEFSYLNAGEGRNKTDCLESASFGLNDLIIRREYADAQKYMLIRENHIQTLFNMLTKLKQDNSEAIHEIIPAWRKQKPKFDIDVKDVGPNNERDYEEIRNTIEEVFKDTYGEDAYFVEYDSSNKYKFSRHIIISGYVFANAAEAKYFTDKLLKPKLAQRLQSQLDWGVNKPNQSFRVLYSPKKGEGRVKQELSSICVEKNVDSLANSLISWPFMDANKDDECEVLPLKCVVSEQENAISNVEIGEQALKAANELIARFGQGAFVAGRDFHTNKNGHKILHLFRVKPSMCCLCKREHTSDNAFIEVDNASVAFKCWRNAKGRESVKLVNSAPAKQIEGGSVEVVKPMEQKDVAEVIAGKKKLLRQKDVAELIANKFKGDIVFVSKNECYIYNQKLAIWKAKNAHDIHIDVSNMAEIALEVVKKAKKTLKKIGEVLFINGVITYLSQILRDESFEARLNKNNELLPIAGAKCVNLRTGEVVERKKEHMFTKQINYNLGVRDERIENFLLSICNGDKQLLDYFKQILGYCLTGELNPAAFFIFWGSGSNGKSTIIDLLSELMGQFADDIQPKVLMDSVKETSKNGHTEHLKAFIGSRMVSVSEFPETGLDAALVKQISGGDNIKMRECGEKARDNAVKLRSTTKLIIMTNNKPAFPNADKGMLRRFFLMPFLATFNENPAEGEYKRDPELIKYIKSELGMANFLYALVCGAQRYYVTKLTELPDCVLREKVEYIEATSPFTEYLSDYMPADKDNKYKRKVSDLYNDFVNSLPKGSPRGSIKELTEYLKSKNYKVVSPKNINHVYIKRYEVSKAELHQHLDAMLV